MKTLHLDYTHAVQKIITSQPQLKRLFYKERKNFIHTSSIQTQKDALAQVVLKLYLKFLSINRVFIFQIYLFILFINYSFQEFLGMK